MAFLLHRTMLPGRAFLYSNVRSRHLVPRAPVRRRCRIDLHQCILLVVWHSRSRWIGDKNVAASNFSSFVAIHKVRQQLKKRKDVWTKIKRKEREEIVAEEGSEKEEH